MLFSSPWLTDPSTTDGEPSGLSEDDLAKSRATLDQVAEQCDACVSEIRRRNEEQGSVVELLVRRKCVEKGCWVY